MYKPTQPLIYSWCFEHEDPAGVHQFMHTNGSYVRTNDWKNRYKVKNKISAIPFRFMVGERSYTGNITDKRLVPRITEYLRDYYGKKYTNCSALAHFLSTGTFIECDPERNLLVLTQGMREYRGEPIRVGDMLCVIYGRDKLLRSRQSPDRKRYLQAKKKRKGNNEFTHALSPKNKILTAKEIEKITKSVLVNDYHFLTCVAKDTDGPVWLCQGGRYPPGEIPSPFVFTVGNNDAYNNKVAILALLKRRR